MIKLNNVSKIFSGKKALEAISIQFADEQTHVLLGSSGCGKSTLLRLIMGLTDPTEGTVELQGQIVNRFNQRSLVQKMGYVVQEGGLFPHLSISQNIALVAKTLGWKRDRIEARLKELSHLVEFDTHLFGRFPKELSGGQRQRASLMRALFLDPSILLLDEPLGALDPIVRSSLQNHLKIVFNQLKKTVLIVTHDIGEAAFFGHSITLMNEGAIVQHGTFEDLVRNPVCPFVTEFINAQRPPPELKVLL
jgi:osmoprotectant transport system ATP-binding protein